MPTRDDSQLTVLIKKADGTFERRPLSELKSGGQRDKGTGEQRTMEQGTKNKEQGEHLMVNKNGNVPRPSSLVPRSVSSTASPITKLVGKKEGTRDKGQGTNLEKLVIKSNNQVPRPASPVPPLSRSDFRSPLEEKFSHPNADLSRLAPTRQDQVGAIVSKLSFKMPPQFENRLRSLIQLRLKEVRDDRQTKEAALRSIKDGGLGITEAQAQEIIERLNINPPVGGQKLKTAVSPVSASGNKATPPLSAQAVRPPANLPMVERAEPMAVSAPFNAFVRRAPPPEKFQISAPPAKKVFNDVAPPAPITVGPVEEIKQLTLTDLRRLSPRPEEAAARLYQKFLNIKEESILLFFQAQAVWRQSPLYREYLKTVGQSLGSGQAVTAIQTPGGITEGEMRALIALEQKIA